MIFLVNRLGDVNAVAAPFLEDLDEENLRTLLRMCAWCSTWSAAAELGRKRRRALELLKAR